ncbi:DUF4445 domain-containing protein [candidate division KSB1 bacterium]|nr:DUF4445 domain-containing protein [candidate division KSB1 bacterium]
MQPVTFKIEFIPLARSLHVAAGTTILNAARKLHVSIPAFCGSRGLCGKCRVTVEKGYFPPTVVEQSLLTAEELKAGIRLACEAKIADHCTIRVTEDKEVLALLEGQVHAVDLSPAVQVHRIKVPQPSLEENSADLKSVLNAAGIKTSFGIPLDFLQKLPHKLREYEYSGSLISVSGRVIDFLPNNSLKGPFGIAVDLGTTTIVGKLYNLVTGNLLAVSAMLNKQSDFGEDVISRISYADKNGGEKLQLAAIESINTILENLSASAEILQDQIYEMTLAGNTVMLHLLLGVPAQFLAVYPFVPAFNGPVYESAKTLGLKMNKNARIYCFPVLGRYVGGDTAALLLTLYRKTLHSWLAIDIGTNGEIVLFHDKKYYFCSAAAGPAFEGAHIKHGMRAMNGAIDHIFYHSGEIHYHVIGDKSPKGLCGSALVDAMAVLHRTGLINLSGAIQSADGFERYVGTHENQPCIYMTQQKNIILTQKDIRQIQLAKGAIAAGVEILLRKTGLAVSDLNAVFLAGAFGQFLDIDNVMYIGLLPEMERRKIHFIGNAACAGAEMALLSVDERRTIQQLLDRAEYVEIATDPAFLDIFTEKMFIH